MRYWLTTHWPPRVDEDATEGSGIWLPDGRQAPGVRIAAGDLVFVYESRSGRTLIRERADGGTERVPCRLGREGIIHLARVSAPMSTDPSAVPETYADASTIWWRWYAPVDVVTRSGFVPRQEVTAALGYKPGYNFRGFGEAHSGLRELTEGEFAELERRFRATRPLVLERRPVPRGAGGGLGGGESDVHRALKQYVAANPAKALGEAGLRTLQIEFPFPTGDRADIVLADRYDRVIGVEVEPEVGSSDDVGVLQAIKYRRMLEWSANRAPGDSRSILVAHAIDEGIRERCATYGVECVVVERRRIGT